MDSFSQPVRRWFADSFPGPTRVQELGWPVLTRGRNALLVAPTGSGKTLAAFLWAIDRLSFEPPQESEEGATREPGVRVLYVSPLKALVYDIDRNLEAPLVGVRRSARKSGVPVRPVTVDVRTGDTTPQERRRQLRRPGEILVTTPESLFLILASQAAANLRTVETVIVDEVHTMVATKRGAHLALSLERLAELTGGEGPQRIGLSATVRPMDLAAEFLGGDRPVEVVDASAPPNIDLQVVVPAPDMEAPPGFETAGMWPSVYPRILDAVRRHRSTIVFVNSRSLCERLAQRLNDLAALDDRPDDDGALKAGRLRCIVATSSLELGIDMGAVDLVLLVEAPGSTARGLQRVGRAGHAVGERSRGLIFPKFRGDLLECTVTAIQMQRGAIESMRMPENPLDVLAQQVVAMCCDREVLRQIKRRTLTKLRREAEPVDGAALARLRSDRPARRAATVMADSGRTHPAGPGAGVPGRDAGPPGVGGRTCLGRSRPVGGTGRQGGGLPAGSCWIAGSRSPRAGRGRSIRRRERSRTGGAVDRSAAPGRPFATGDARRLLHLRPRARRGRCG